MLRCPSRDSLVVASPFSCQAVYYRSKFALFLSVSKALHKVIRIPTFHSCRRLVFLRRIAQAHLRIRVITFSIILIFFLGTNLTATSQVFFTRSENEEDRCLSHPMLHGFVSRRNLPLSGFQSKCLTVAAFLLGQESRSEIVTMFYESRFTR